MTHREVSASRTRAGLPPPPSPRRPLAGNSYNPINSPQRTWREYEQSFAYQSAAIGAQRHPGTPLPPLYPSPPFGDQGFLPLAPESNTATTSSSQFHEPSELDTDYYQTFDNESEDEQKNPNLEHVWIAVMGVTGSGKSSFIQLCTGKNIGIGHSLVSFTYEVEEYTFVHENRYMIHLIDTPGFDDTKRTDTDVLRDISTWLGESYSNKIRVSGILYLHPINNARMTGSAGRNLFMFKKLIGENAFRRVILATTMWEGVTPADGSRREAELANTPDFWGSMIQKHSVIMRHTHENRDSAMKILHRLIHGKEKVALAIQEEMVDQQLRLDETGAGQQINQDIIKLQEKHKKELETLAREKEEAIKERDNDSAEAIRELEERRKEEIREAIKAGENLRVDMNKLREDQKRQITELEEKYARDVAEWNERREEFEAWKSQSDPSDRADMAEFIQRKTRLDESSRTLSVRKKKVHRRKKALGLLEWIATT